MKNELWSCDSDSAPTPSVPSARNWTSGARNRSRRWYSMKATGSITVPSRPFTPHSGTWSSTRKNDCSLACRPMSARSMRLASVSLPPT